MYLHRIITILTCNISQYPLPSLTFCHVRICDEVVHVSIVDCRMLVLLCIVNLLNYVDRGVIASNGVNGTPRDAKCNSVEACQGGSGIQYIFWLFQGTVEQMLLVYRDHNN